METKNSLLGFLKDSGVSAMICGRIEALIDAFNGNLDQFVIATNGQIEATYNKNHPGSPKGLGIATYKAMDLLRGRYRHANAQMREAGRNEGCFWQSSSQNRLYRRYHPSEFTGWSKLWNSS